MFDHETAASGRPSPLTRANTSWFFQTKSKAVDTGKSLEQDCGWISWLFFLYLDSLFALGNERTLEMKDLGVVSKKDSASYVYENFAKHYEYEKTLPVEKRSLWRPLWRSVGYGYLYTATFLFFISAALSFGPVLLLSRLVAYFVGIVSYTKFEVWAMVVLLFLFPILASLFTAHSNVIMSHIGCQVRNMLLNVIYRKSLVVSSHTRQTISTGRIITMFSEDTSQIRTFLFFLCNTIVSPFQVAVCLYLLYQQVGVATFVGLGYSFFVIPFSGIAFGIVAKLRKDKMIITDYRVKLINEILSGVRILKYYAWEKPFQQKIMETRDKEIVFLQKMGYVFNITFSLFLISAPQIQAILIFFTYISLDHQLDIKTAFTTLTLFGMMTTPFIFIPYGLQQFSQCQVSMKRILVFLDSPELAGYITDMEPVESSLKDARAPVVIRIKDANLGWTPIEDEKTIADKVKTAASNNPAYSTVPSDDKGREKEGGKDPEVGSIEEDKKDIRSTKTLTNLNVEIREGQLVGIVGRVGSGKSSILSAVLGEMFLNRGSVEVKSGLRIAFCDQRAYVINASVKDNVIFNQPYDEESFQQAVESACLSDDLKILPQGVATEIGERGITLSGGQKTRVSLARAVYSDADIYLLDDPLSAVDAHVGEFLVQHCFLNKLHGKTRLLVTHHVRVLPKCDLVIVLDNEGSIAACGTYDEILQSGVNIDNFIEKQEEKSDESKEEKEQNRERSGSVPVDDNPSVASNVDTNQEDSPPVSNPSPRASPRTGKADSKDKHQNDGHLMSTEEKNEGSVKGRTYWAYISSGGIVAFSAVIFGQLSSQVIQIWANFHLTRWGEETSKDLLLGEKMSHQRNFHWLHIYAAMLMSSVFFGLVSRVSIVVHRTNASRLMHDNLLRKVLYFPISFFDTTPIGRVINRFSQDMATIDEDLASTVSQMVGMGGAVLGSIGAIVGTTKGSFLILIVPLTILYGKFNAYFRKSNTAMARLESVSRSPIYADFSQTLSGVFSIRSYRQEDNFIKRLEMYTDENTVPNICQQIAMQWLSLRLDFLGAIVLFFMGSVAVGFKKYDFIPAGYLAMGLSYSIQMTSMLKVMVRGMATMEAQFNSIERVTHYIEADLGIDGQKRKFDTNPPYNTSTDVVKTHDKGDIEMSLGVASSEAFVNADQTARSTLPPNWPSEGAVEFRNVFMRYRELDCVLKDVSFAVKPKEKIGIAGRTGCGKSSLMVSLFRIEELVSGQILIDGIDISTLPVQELRSKLCIIPQDPVMFSASVRFNLDPFTERTDDDIWDVLASVNMTSTIKNLTNQLDEMVAESGENFSAGQRQLICIARALLRKPKILVMDEATASVDGTTDDLIQLMIRTKFVDCTVLTIAHRLNTIMDSSKILVMDAGTVAEYDSPEALLALPQGKFKSLWDNHVTSGGKK